VILTPLFVDGSVVLVRGGQRQTVAQQSPNAPTGR
jgi:hypothetical protein